MSVQLFITVKGNPFNWSSLLTEYFCAYCYFSQSKLISSVLTLSVSHEIMVIFPMESCKFCSFCCRPVSLFFCTIHSIFSWYVIQILLETAPDIKVQPTFCCNLNNNLWTCVWERISSKDVHRLWELAKESYPVSLLIYSTEEGSTWILQHCKGLCPWNKTFIAIYSLKLFEEALVPSPVTIIPASVTSAIPTHTQFFNQSTWQ